MEYLPVGSLDQSKGINSIINGKYMANYESLLSYLKISLKSLLSKAKIITMYFGG